MRHFKRVILAVLVCAAIVGAFALAEGGPLNALWHSGSELLFHTDNVTVDGTAVFSLNGTMFKTAGLHYVQDGYSSYYGLKLITPKKSGGEQETGWTIIADDEGDVYVMEAYYPGVYREGTCAANNTLLRRTVQLDALTELGGFLVGQIEPLLPEGAVTVEEKDGQQTVHIRLGGDQIPPMAVSALNTAAAYLSNRWFSYGYDRVASEEVCPDFDNYVTVSQALTDGTVRWELRAAEADFILDAQGRLAGAKGKATAESTFWDGKKRDVEVEFDFTVSGWDESHVKPFDPDDFGVKPAYEVYTNDGGEEIMLDEEEVEQMTARAGQILEKFGYLAMSDVMGSGYWTSQFGVNISLETEEDEYFCLFDKDGNLNVLQHVTGDWLEAGEQPPEGISEETRAAAEQAARALLKEVNPALEERMAKLQPRSMIVTEKGKYLTLDEGAEYGPNFIVRTEPSVRVEYYGAGNVI